MAAQKSKFRSLQTYGCSDRDEIIRRSWTKDMGLLDDVLDAHHAIRVCSAWRRPCNKHLPARRAHETGIKYFVETGGPSCGAPPSQDIARGTKDMVRVFDARMGGPDFGTVILHITQESQADGLVAILRSAGETAPDGHGRKLPLPDTEIEARLAAWRQDRPPKHYEQGYCRGYVDHVLQADRGCDLDFLVGKSGSTVNSESHQMKKARGRAHEYEKSQRR